VRPSRREHTRLGLTEDEWWARHYEMALSDSKGGAAIWDAIQGYRNENAVTDLLDAA
jgi:hypothetical protein